MPEAPMQVVQDTTQVPTLLPPANLIDLAHEPSYALVQKKPLTGSLAAPNGYGFWAQDLVAGNYFAPSTGTVTLNVLSETMTGVAPASIELLGNVINPRIVIPAQEPVFDSMDPFFVADGGGDSSSVPRPARTYLVQPEFYTASSSPQPIDNMTYVRQWTT